MPLIFGSAPQFLIDIGILSCVENLTEAQNYVHREMRISDEFTESARLTCPSYLVIDRANKINGTLQFGTESVYRRLVELAVLAYSLDRGLEEFRLGTAPRDLIEKAKWGYETTRERPGPRMAALCQSTLADHRHMAEYLFKDRTINVEHLL